jgi:hypothetical protein
MIKRKLIASIKNAQATPSPFTTSPAGPGAIRVAICAVACAIELAADNCSGRTKDGRKACAAGAAKALPSLRVSGAAELGAGHLLLCGGFL